MFKIAICDDEEILSRKLQECLDRYGGDPQSGRHDGAYVPYIYLSVCMERLWVRGGQLPDQTPISQPKRKMGCVYLVAYMSKSTQEVG